MPCCCRAAGENAQDRDSEEIEGYPFRHAVAVADDQEQMRAVAESQTDVRRHRREVKEGSDIQTTRPRRMAIAGPAAAVQPAGLSRREGAVASRGTIAMIPQPISQYATRTRPSSARITTS